MSIVAKQLDGSRCLVRCSLITIFSTNAAISQTKMDQDATWYGGRPGPRRRCVRGVV